MLCKRANEQASKRGKRERTLAHAVRETVLWSPVRATKTVFVQLSNVLSLAHAHAPHLCLPSHGTSQVRADSSVQYVLLCLAPSTEHEIVTEELLARFLPIASCPPPHPAPFLSHCHHCHAVYPPKLPLTKPLAPATSGLLALMLCASPAPSLHAHALPTCFASLGRHGLNHDCVRVCARSCAYVRVCARMCLFHDLT